MDQVMQFVEPSRQFVKDSIRLVKRCTKPDRKEFQKIAMATAIGFAIMGFIGFFVKLIHIPINNIIVMLCDTSHSGQRSATSQSAVRQVLGHGRPGCSCPKVSRCGVHGAAPPPPYLDFYACASPHVQSDGGMSGSGLN
ncbi:protein transport protein Sec61 subunit gamma isoform X1 [Thamnophis elegans]|uniref:protein transport protein Sec61 subunit gamma isoform X1 n=1 Tax=Thamnophis elegans TaxID=35005 RepID=UPI00137904ED|nr:protein transport protein Sec61 subunit gamma isoform X1 [Thamnophis elegans]